MTFRARLALWYSGLLTLILIIFSIVVLAVSRMTILQTIDDLLGDVATSLVRSMQPPDTASDGLAFDSLSHSESLFHEPGLSVQVWRVHQQDEEVVTVLERASDDLVEHHDPLAPTLIHNDHRQYHTITFSNIPMRVVSHPLHTESGDLFAVVQVATPLHAVQESQGQLLVIMFITGAISILVSVGVGKWTARHLLRPVDAIAGAANSIARAEDLSTRLQWDGPNDELGELTAVFNHMMERLDKLFSVQQRFISDVSHELRTPLTAMLGHLEIVERYGTMSGPDAEACHAIHAEANRMSHLVQDLLFLTRADAGKLELRFKPMSLDEVAMSVHEKMLSQDSEHDLSFVVKRMDAVQIDGDEHYIEILLTHLMTNAVKFTPPGGTITLQVYEDEGYGYVEVHDTGVGIPQEAVPHIFDRFYQVDDARTSIDDEEEDGAGLGLSIARWIVEQHFGTIQVISRVGAGSVFQVRLPVTHDPPPPSGRNDENTPKCAFLSVWRNTGSS